MNYTPRLALLTIALGLLAACSSPTRQAPVIDRPIPKTNHNAKPATPVQPPVVVAEEPKQEANGSYTVRKGDTLLRIALDHGQNYRDLVTWNNLRDPDDIKVGQVLKVSPPERMAGTTPVTVPKIEPIGPKKPSTPTPEKKQDVAEAAKPPARPETASSGPAPGTVVTATDDERLSWMWPASGKIVATFDDNKKGIDIAGKPGQQVLAAGAGKVMYAGSGIRGYGNLVIVKHSNTLLSAYAHNKVIMVKEGDTVSKGQVIAEMGDTDADSVKLHFEIRLQGKPVDPARFLPSR